MNFSEYYQLALLLCEDFPESIMLKVYKATIMYSTQLKNKDTLTNHQLNEKFKDLEQMEEQKIIELPAFQTFLVSFRSYLFYFEFFEILLDTIFEGDYFHSISTQILTKTCNHLMDTSLQGLKNSNSIEREQYCVPSEDQIEFIVEKSKAIRKRLNHTQMNDMISFAEFSEAFFQHVTDVSNRNQQPSSQQSIVNTDVISLLDTDYAPLSVSCAERQKLRLRKEILKLYSGMKDGSSVTSSVYSVTPTGSIK